MLDKSAAEQIRTALHRSVEAGELAGANLLVARNGEETFYCEAGLADREESIPIRRDSLFRLYSMTKPVTATALMILLERGEIELCESVGKFLPGFRNQKVAIGEQFVAIEREMMLSDLLSMTSGLVYGGPDHAGRGTERLFANLVERLEDENPMGTVEFANQLGEFPLSFQPGTDWSYGTSADVLGAIIEVVSGMRFGEFLEKELFSPLRMNDTGFWLKEEKRSRLARTYASQPEGGMILYEGNHLGILHQMDRNPAFESGGAGLLSSLDDYARFANMLMNGGSLDGKQILRPKTVAHLCSRTLDDKQQSGFIRRFPLPGHTYGNLMRVLIDPGSTRNIGCTGEYGWDGWLGCYFCNCPEDGLSFVFMTQRKDAGTMEITRKLRNIILSACSQV